jgi:hypothetical protein
MIDHRYVPAGALAPKPKLDPSRASLPMRADPASRYNPCAKTQAESDRTARGDAVNARLKIIKSRDRQTMIILQASRWSEFPADLIKINPERP